MLMGETLMDGMDFTAVRTRQSSAMRYRMALVSNFMMGRNVWGWLENCEEINPVDVLNSSGNHQDVGLILEMLSHGGVILEIWAIRSYRR